MEKNKVFVQIGTNDGNDDFRQLVIDYTPSKVILIEPLRKLINKIENNYFGFENVFIENVAITDINKGEVKLVLPKNNINGHSVNGVVYGDKCYSLLPMNDWGDDFHEEIAKSMTFNELCDKYNIYDIHYLQIDTEGYDAQIIKSIDFNKVNIDIIRYESWNFSPDCFTRHGDKGKEYGSNGIIESKIILEKNGYKISEVVTSHGELEIIGIKKI